MEQWELLDIENIAEINVMKGLEDEVEARKDWRMKLTRGIYTSLNEKKIGKNRAKD